MMKTKYLFSHLVGLIQPSLNLLNVSLKKKDMPYLNTKTQFALVGTTNKWCPTAIQQMLHKELEKRIDSMKKDGQLCNEYSNCKIPPFFIPKTKMRLPKMDMVSKQDMEFVNYFERLRNCYVIMVADADWPWMKGLMEGFFLVGKLKRTISHQASILELTHGQQSSFANRRFLKGKKLRCYITITA